MKIRETKAALRKFFQSRGFLWLVAGLILVALLARLAFLLVDYPELTTDPASYFYNAKSLAATGTLDESGWWGRDYVARFPYIYNYMWLLSVSMRLVGSGPGAIIALNTLLSAAGAILMYLLFAKGLKNRRVGLLAAALWFASPVEIFYTALPLPVVAVNTCLVAALFTAFVVLDGFRRSNGRRFWVYALVLGAALGIANIFRPMMGVLLIALALVIGYILLREFRGRGFRPRLLARAAGGLLAVFVVMTGVQQLALLPPKNITGYDNLVYGSGWSLFLGSNRESGGRWNDADNLVQGQVADRTAGYWPEYNRELTDLALDRYGEFGLSDFFPHWWNKAAAVTAGLAGSVNFEFRNFPAGIRGFYAVAVQIYFPLLLTVFMGVGLYLFLRRRPRSLDGALAAQRTFVVLTALTLLGIFGSYVLLTEVMDRYATPLLPLMFVIGLWGCCIRLATPKSVGGQSLPRHLSQ